MAADTIFNNSKLWQHYGCSADYQERIKIILDLIPENVNTVLDIGCGKGDIVNTLCTHTGARHVVGCEVSPEALTYVMVPAVRAGLPSLPFAEKSFDLVICLEVLEHIAHAGYAAALREIRRIAKEYIIIGVPFQENLLTKQVLCAVCGRLSHADGHIRSYTSKTLRSLLADFTLTTDRYAGVCQRRHTKTGIFLRQKIGGIYYKPELFHCPYCGSKQIRETKPGLHTLFREMTKKLNNRLLERKKSEPYWVISLYRRSHG
jgi:SAM-dependent methyltransferase